MITVLTETQERFFLAIGKELPLERVIEIHLFQPLRQGGVESGVAVVAAVPEGEALDDEAAPALEQPHGIGDDEPIGEVAAEAANVSATDANGAEEDAHVSAFADDLSRAEMPEHDEFSSASPDESDADERDDSSPDPDLANAPARRARRYTVYTAHYRHVLKGPDRGKWEASVVAEADAPLLTVDTVVRGVLRRSGDESEPERLSGHEMRAALRQTGASSGTAG